jgi:hypothetical protein
LERQTDGGKGIERGRELTTAKALLIFRVSKIMQFALVWLSCKGNYLEVGKKLLAEFFMASKELHSKRINYHSPSLFPSRPFSPTTIYETGKTFWLFSLFIACMQSQTHPTPCERNVCT